MKRGGGGIIDEPSRLLFFPRLFFPRLTKISKAMGLFSNWSGDASSRSLIRDVANRRRFSSSPFPLSVFFPPRPRLVANIFDGGRRYPEVRNNSTFLLRENYDPIRQTSVSDGPLSRASTLCTLFLIFHQTE